MARLVVIFIFRTFFSTKATAMLVLVKYIEWDDVAHWSDAKLKVILLFLQNTFLPCKKLKSTDYEPHAGRGGTSHLCYTGIFVEIIKFIEKVLKLFIEGLA